MRVPRSLRRANKARHTQRESKIRKHNSPLGPIDHRNISALFAACERVRVGRIPPATPVAAPPSSAPSVLPSFLPCVQPGQSCDSSGASRAGSAGQAAPGLVFELKGRFARQSGRLVMCRCPKCAT